MKLITSNKNESEVLMSLIGIGVCKSLLGNLLTLEMAEKIIFCPYVLEKLKTLKTDKLLLDAIHLGMELEDVKRLTPDLYDNSIIEIQQEFNKILQKHKSIDLPDPKWLR